MKKTNFKIGLMALSIVLAVTVVLASCKKKNGDDDDGGNSNSSPIVGMWRSKKDFIGDYYTVGVVFFNSDGTYQVIRYWHDRFIGEKGKFKLNGNNLELQDLFEFERHDNALSMEFFLTDLTKIRDLINSGTRKEVEAIIDPKHSIWQHYGGITGTVGWIDMNTYGKGSKSATIEWIDKNTIDYLNGLRKPLERVP